MIQFTFTSVELREEAGARWLAMDYAQQVRGGCERTFHYDARVRGFTPQTRAVEFLTDAKAGFAPVRHQRVSWKLPDDLPQIEVQALRDRVAREWIGKSAAIEPGDERVLFKVAVPDGGTLATAVGVRLSPPASAANSRLPPDAAHWVRLSLNFAKIRVDRPISNSTPFWIVVDFSKETHGECDLHFTKEGGFGDDLPDLKTSVSAAEERHNPAVVHQRVEFRLPSGMTYEEARSISERVSAQWAGKPLFIQPLAGNKHPLIDLDLPGRGRAQVKVNAYMRPGQSVRPSILEP